MPAAVVSHYAEMHLLAVHAGEIVAALGEPEGTSSSSGAGAAKSVLLAEALTGRGGSAHLIDISSQALEQTEQRLHGLQHVSVVGHWSTSRKDCRAVAARKEGSTMLVLLLGSNIGNFDPPAATVPGAHPRRLDPGDPLLGADLVKPERDLSSPTTIRWA